MTSEILAFGLACILLIITPGPGVLSVAGVGAGFGFKKAQKYYWGLCLGNSLVAICVASGIAAAVFAIDYVREILLVISVGYMLFLAAKIAFAGSKIGFIEAQIAPRFIDGLALQIVNPKAYVANSLLFSGFNFMPESLFTEFVIKFLIWNLIWIPIHFGWLFAGVSLRRLNLSASSQRAINFGMSASMILVLVLALFANQ